jgi:regulation of enolase protein 1 (concanavalin A-like superfamily)
MRLYKITPCLFACLLIFLAAGPAGTTQARAFVHPGGLHTKADLDRMKSEVAAGAHPWIDGWDRLIADPKAQNNYRASPQENMGSRQQAQNDATSAYLNAIRWYISGDKSYADCAVRNLNGWSAKVNQVPHGNDQPGLGGIPIGNFALAAEILRIYPGWAEEDQVRFKHMLLTYFYPACDDFLTYHNGGGNTRYWANWDTCNILAVMAIGVFCDDDEKFDQAVTYFKTGAGNGSILNAVNNLYPGGLGQWQESGRDQAHALGGMGLLAEACQVAWNQNVDLFGYSDNRLLAGAEYTAQYTLWKGVSYTYYTNADNAKQFYISTNYHGRLDNCQFFELLYNHYVVMKGLSAPNVERFAKVMRPENGNADLFGYGTLTYTLKADASPYPPSPVPPVPMDLTATAGIERVDLKWSPSGAYSTQGYNVLRATASEGPYNTVFSTTTNTSPRFTDTTVINGTTYYYVVSAINQAGASANSVPASATPVVGGPIPEGWVDGDVGKAHGSSTYAGAANKTFVVVGEGAGIKSTADDCHYVYKTVTGDFTITARLIANKGNVDKTGLMMRESTDTDSPTLALTLGERGGREARFRTRRSKGEEATTQFGCDYTWTPVWFRLQRAGNIFTASQSSDGSAWFVIDTSTCPLAASYLVGMVAASGNDAESATATFDNVDVDVMPPTPPPAPSGLAAAAPERGSIQLAWTNKAANQTGCKVECSTDNVHFYEIADLDADATSFVNTGLSNSTAYYYRVRAYNTGGYSAYSNTASPASTAPTGSP